MNITKLNASTTTYHLTTPETGEKTATWDKSNALTFTPTYFSTTTDAYENTDHLNKTKLK